MQNRTRKLRGTKMRKCSSWHAIPNDFQPFIRNRISKTLEVSNRKSMLQRHLSNFLNLSYGQISANRIRFEFFFQRQNHRLGHAGECQPRRKAKIKIKTNVARRSDHSTIEHQDVLAKSRVFFGNIVRLR